MSQIRLPNGDIAETLVVVNPQTGLPADIGGGSSATTTIQTFYIVTTAFPGASKDDSLINTQVISNVNAHIVGSTWVNSTTGDTLPSPPPAANISQQSNSAITNAQLRAENVGVYDSAAIAKLEQLRVQLVTLLGNTDGIETLQANTNNLVALTNQYVDGVEALVATLNSNTDGLEPLLSSIQGYVDALEPLLQDIKTIATADATKQDAINSKLAEIRDRLPSSLGQKTATGSVGVVLASDQPLPLPAGASTAAKQDAQTSLLTTTEGNTASIKSNTANIDTKTPSLGQALKAGSVPVALASDGDHAKDATVFGVKTSVDALSAKVPSALGQKTSGNSLSVVLASDNAQATEATLAQVRDAIKAQIDIASTLWTDDSGAYYVRRDLVNEGTGAITVSFATPTGAAATPGVGLRPLSSIEREITQTLFDATSSGTGYSSGQLLMRVIIVDIAAAPAAVTTFWSNISAGTILSSSPADGTYERADESIGVRQLGTWSIGDITGTVSLPSGAATESSVAATSSAIGNKNDVAASSDSGTHSIVAFIKRGLSNWTALLAKIPALVSNQVPVTDRGAWASESVTGRTRDTSKDMAITYGDGTAETLYFTTAGDYAGKSARA